MPPAVMPNSVAPLPKGGFVATSFGIRTDPQTYQKAMAGGISGFVAQWLPGAGWSEVPGTQFSANNGIAISADGKVWVGFQRLTHRSLPPEAMSKMNRQPRSQEGPIFRRHSS